MSEATIQARLIEALTPLVAEGSVLLNDHVTPQNTSRERSPWLVVETADAIRADTGPGYTTPSATYEPYVAVVIYPRNSTQEEHEVLAAFQTLRQTTIAALLNVENVELVETVGGLAAYHGDGDGLFQRLRIRVTEYEV